MQSSILRSFYFTLQSEFWDVARFQRKLSEGMGPNDFVF